MNILNSIGRMLEGFSLGTLTGKVIITVGSLITAFYSPIVALLFACFMFTIVDMIYGIKVANKQHQKITSDKNWKGTISKLSEEFTIISLARLLEFSVVGTSEVSLLTGGVTVIVCLTEFWSILENLNTLDPNGPWRALGKFLKKKGEDYTGIELNLKENDNHNYKDNNICGQES